jgi:hypothetical protein
MGGSTLSVSAHYGQKSGFSKGSMSGSVKSQRFGPRTYGFNDEERGRGNGFAELTPTQRERLRGMMRERFAELTPMQRERVREFVRERIAELSPMQRERLGGAVRERFGELTPMQRERLGGIVRERRAHPNATRTRQGFVRERLYRHGPYGSR